jgi:hypothetical protein
MDIMSSNTMEGKVIIIFVASPSYYPHDITTDGRPLELDPLSQLTQQANSQEGSSASILHSKASTDWGNKSTARPVAST